ncbi:MAG: HlyC/CorC family transporter [Bacilli bacterium]|nr:HlyC/CorC family transporter [Bacilli bacterium]
MNEPLLIGIVVVCLLFSAYFSATETAFSTFNKIKMRNLADKGNKSAKLVLNIEETYDTMLSTILIGNNIVNILSASLSTILFIGWIDDKSGPTVSTAVMTIIVLIFGEITPKTLAKQIPDKFAMFAAPFLKLLMIIFFVFTFIFKKWQDLISKLVKSKDEDIVTEEEILTLVEEAAEDGSINESESELIKSAIEFGDLEVIDIFTPRVDIIALPKDATYEDIDNAFSGNPFSRLPIYDEDIDHIVGIIYYKDFYQAEEQNFKLENIIKQPMFVMKHKLVNELLKEFQTQKQHFAVVADEFGSVAGIVTMEDILEEIVGEIWDEYDEIFEDIKQVSETVYIISGKANVDKVLEVFDIEKDIEPVTVNGWIAEELKTLPTRGTKLRFENLNIEVIKMKGRRIDSIKVTVLPKEIIE